MSEEGLEWVDALLVKGLKEHLKSRKLSTSGRKQQLIDRLKEHVRQEKLNKAAEVQEQTAPSQEPEQEAPAEDGKDKQDDGKGGDGEKIVEKNEQPPIEIDLVKDEGTPVTDEKHVTDIPAGPEMEAEEQTQPKDGDKIKDLSKKEMDAAPETKEQEIDDILGEDEMDDMAFELEPTLKGRKRRAPPSRTVPASAGEDAQMKDEKPQAPHDATKDVPSQGDNSDKLEKGQAGSTVDGTSKDQEEMCVDNLGSSDLKKRKLEEAPRAALDHQASTGGETGVKRKRIPIPVPVPGNKDSSQFSLGKSGSLTQSQVEAIEPGAPPTPAIASCAIRINNFVRPFVEKNCRELLEQYGKVTDMWMPSIKTHCYVVYETEEQAMRAYKSTYNLEWPVGGRKLIPLIVPAEEARLEIERGRARSAGKNSTSTDLQGVSNAGYARANSGMGMASDNRLERGPSGTHPQFGGPYRRPVNRPVTLEDLFFKTHTKPPLYYLPLTDEQIMEKRKQEPKTGNTEVARRAEVGGVNGGLPANTSPQGSAAEVRDEVQEAAA